jgi:flagellar hook-associated protein 3 FlgL
MITYVDPATAQFLSGLNQIQQRATQAQRELTTGLRITSVSDDPDQVTSLIQTRSELAQTQQLDANLGRVKPEVDTAESGLQSAVSLLDRAMTLGSEGESNLESAQQRQFFAGELGSVLQQLVRVSQTTVEGRYIFSGDSDHTPPYTIDLTQANPISAYAGSPSTRQIEMPAGTLVSVSKTAQDIFDSPDATQNVFQAVNNLRTALLNNDQAAIDAALPNMQSAGTYLNTQLAFYGTVQDRITSGQNYGSSYETSLTTQIAGIQDADATQAITQLTLAQTQEQAALESRAKLPTMSLFDYLA